MLSCLLCCWSWSLLSAVMMDGCGWFVHVMLSVVVMLLVRLTFKLIVVLLSWSVWVVMAGWS